MARVREFIVIVGGPSNTFNGYGHFDTDKWHAEPPPADTSPANIRKYLQGDLTGHSTTNPAQTPTGTHDLYWANFLYGAVKLVELRGRIPETINPQRGDLLTFMVYLPPYTLGKSVGATPEDRQAVDWDASPYNIRHRNSAYVNSSPYNPNFKRQLQGITIPVPLAPPTRTTRITTPPTYSAVEADVNHEIMMRTTSDLDASGNPVPDGGFHKRPHDPTAYVDAITEIPDRLCYGARHGSYSPVSGVAPLVDVYVKVLFVRTLPELYGYLKTGTWTGRRRLSQYELVDEEHMLRGEVSETTWAGQALQKPGTKRPQWDGAPSVKRDKVKIRRLDYVGHSAPAALFLEYGIKNAKGAEPEASVFITADDVLRELPPSVFASNVKIRLWGCFLAQDFAPKLVPLVQEAGAIRAAWNRTTFDKLLDNELSIPEPSDPTETWMTFP